MLICKKSVCEYLLETISAVTKMFNISQLDHQEPLRKARDNLHATWPPR